MNTISATAGCYGLYRLMVEGIGSCYNQALLSIVLKIVLKPVLLIMFALFSRFVSYVFGYIPEGRIKRILFTDLDSRAMKAARRK